MDLLLSLLPVLLIGIPFVLWIVMLVHAIKNEIPSKALWLIVLILGNIIGGIVYYFAVYHDMSKKGLGLRKHSTIISVVIVAALFIIMLLAFRTQPIKLQEVPLSEVIKQAKNGEIKKIEVKGDELKITKRGDTLPSEHSRKEKGSSLYQQGLTNRDVELYVKN